MYEVLSTFNNIVVSGPQRSGTRVAAKIIAQDTNKNYVDEKDVNSHDFRLLEWYLGKGNVVIQCPGLCHLLHKIINSSTLVIVVRRRIHEILASEHRAWNNPSKNMELFKYGYSSGIISQIKYDYWDSYQQPILGDNGRNIKYQDLQKHELFIFNRKDFRWDQTK